MQMRKKTIDELAALLKRASSEGKGLSLTPDLTKTFYALETACLPE